MRIKGIFSKPGDTVVTVTGAVSPGDEVEYIGEKGLSLVKAVSAVPVYHKISIVPKKKGEIIKKYGERIGVAIRDIEVGEHAHSHNLASFETGDRR